MPARFSLLLSSAACQDEAYLARYPALGEDDELRLRQQRGDGAPALLAAGSPVHGEHVPARLQRLPLPPEHSPCSGPDTLATTLLGLPHHLPSNPLPLCCSPEEAAAACGLRLERELGRGGMGVVYLAHDLERCRSIALKTLCRLDDPAALFRFKREFRALVDVAHPNLATLHELKAEGPLWFFTMEYVAGVDWLRYIRAAAAPSRPERLRATLRQLAEGLTALHAAGKLHRDVKPSNVLVEPGGRVVLLDFGLVAELDPHGQHFSRTSGVVGTALYVAPEQWAGLPVSPASDWYSVGVMLYEALTGQPPFHGPALQLLHDKQQGEPPAPSAVAPGVPEDLDALCRALLQRDPEARPAGRDVLLRLGHKVVPPSSPRPGFVGRQAQLRILHEAFGHVQQGRPVAVHLHGPAGAGKSTLVRHFLDALGQRGDVVLLQGRCYEQESLPYKVLDSLIDDLSRCLARLPSAEVRALLPRDVHHLVRVFPVLGRVPVLADAHAWPGSDSADPHETPRRAAVALRGLLGRLGDRHPLVLFIDDVHGGDADSAALLAELFRPADAPALLLLACSRGDEPTGGAFLRACVKQHGGPAAGLIYREVAVEPLAAE